MKNYKVIFMIDGNVNEAYFKEKNTAEKFCNMLFDKAEMYELREKENDMWYVTASN